MKRRKLEKRGIAFFLIMVLLISICGNVSMATEKSDGWNTEESGKVSPGENNRENEKEEESVNTEEGSPPGETIESDTTEESVSQETYPEESETESTEQETESQEESASEETEGQEESTEQETESQEESAPQESTEESTSGEMEESTDEVPKERITAWEWGTCGEDLILTWMEEEKEWQAEFIGVSESNPLTSQALLEYLPQSIYAYLDQGKDEEIEGERQSDEKLSETEEGTSDRSLEGETEKYDTEIKQVEEKRGSEEKQEISLIWDLSALPDRMTEGTYSITAKTEPNYEWKEELPLPKITLKLGEAQQQDLSDYTVKNTVSPKGTKINLFDYWIQPGRDDTNPDGFQNMGINQYSGLKFSNGGFGTGSGINGWTGSGAVFQDIVKKTLVGNYPQLTDAHGGDSLSYLFDLQERDGKAVYPDVEKLLQVDELGYYYYNSTNNYAEYDESSNSFILYKKGGVKAGGQSGKGQFFPFNSAADVFYEWGGDIELKEIKSNDAKMNHYFGVSMSTRFIQENGGMIDKNGKKIPVTYEFSGDDDVWVFIDGVLVADLGGIHNAAKLKIDFSTGNFTINDKPDGNLKSKFEDAGVDGNFQNGTNTFRDNTYHTLDFYYLERGNVDSNMSLKFNLVTVPESSIIKVDQVGNAVPDAEFALFATDENYSEGSKKLLAKGVTDANGEFVLTDGTGKPISINGLVQEGYQYFLLDEVRVPDGYRSAGSMKLYVPDQGKTDHPVLLSKNAWETGAYASSSVLVSAGANVKDVNGGSHPVADGTLFAVVLQHSGNGDISDPNQWRTVTGSPLTGWKVGEKSADLSEIIAAAKEEEHTFIPTASGAYEAEILNLPGDILSYYYMMEGDKSKAKYTIAYYYTEAKSLDGATTSNTVRLDSGDNNFTRIFAANLYVPNIENHLYVQKLDDTDEVFLTGAEFSLYEENQVTVDESGNASLSEGAVAYDTVTTKESTDIYKIPGAAMFPSGTGKPLQTGKTYYLKETKAPKGYQVSDKLIKILVTDQGVYADAGSGEDEVSVQVGVGRLVHSMIQFAPLDKVDATLHDIKALLQTASTTLDWQPEDDADDKALHLSYSDNENNYEYGPNNEAGTTTDTRIIQAGWGYLKVQQCLNHDGNTKETPKQNLGTQDLTALFSGMTNVQVRNQKVGGLEISKMVTGDGANKGQDFTFSLTLNDSKGAPFTEELSAVKTANGEESQVPLTNVDGRYSFPLKDGESIRLENLPVGTQYEVKEVDVPSNYIPSVTIDGEACEGTGTIATGTIEHKWKGEDLQLVQRIAFTNQYTPDVILTGDFALKGRKTLEGRNMNGGDHFTFQLAPHDEVTKQAVNDGTILLPAPSTVNVTGNGMTNQQQFSFGDVTVKTEGTFQFAITEKKGEIPEMVYDSHTAVVIVEVTRNPTEGLVLEGISYSNTDAPSKGDQEETQMAAFTNSLNTSFTFQKRDENKNPLSGAVFGIYRQICGESHKNDLVGMNGEGNPTDNNCWELLKIAVSGADGMVKFDSLPAHEDGVYRLVEIKAPEGYTRPTGQWNLFYDKTSGQLCPVEGEGGSVSNPPAIEKLMESESQNEASYGITNYKPFQIPFSGSKGIQAFLLIGGSLMTAGILWGILRYLHRKRKLL